VKKRSRNDYEHTLYPDRKGGLWLSQSSVPDRPSLWGKNYCSQLIGGDNECTPTGISQEEIGAALAAAGPSGFDPRSDLEMYQISGYWFYGENDHSVPVPQSVDVLEQIGTIFGTDFAIEVYPNANHSLIVDGAICQGFRGSHVPSILSPEIRLTGSA
ncbi:MAG: dienelactone hydrolase family protein, partial [Gammaproteobacteria bacterium]|nr:dienelactone hydrolase family protein [Gammaproteobacteria bacterium]